MVVNCSSVIRCSIPSHRKPAAGTTMWTFPYVRMARSASRSPMSGSVTEPASPTASPANPSIWRSVSSSGSWSRSLATMHAPSRASRSATPCPMPRPAPVTIATRPSMPSTMRLLPPRVVRPILPQRRAPAATATAPASRTISALTTIPPRRRRPAMAVDHDLLHDFAHALIDAGHNLAPIAALTDSAPRPLRGRRLPRRRRRAGARDRARPSRRRAEGGVHEPRDPGEARRRLAQLRDHRRRYDRPQRRARPARRRSSLPRWSRRSRSA